MHFFLFKTWQKEIFINLSKIYVQNALNFELNEG